MVLALPLLGCQSWGIPPPQVICAFKEKEEDVQMCPLTAALVNTKHFLFTSEHYYLYILQPIFQIYYIRVYNLT